MQLDSGSATKQPASVQIGRALRRLRGRKVTQESLGEVLGVSQGTVSQWEAGRSSPNFDQMQKIEDHLGLPLGAILIAAELVAASDIEAAIVADPSLDADQVHMLLTVYRSLVDPHGRGGKSRKSGARNR